MQHQNNELDRPLLPAWLKYPNIPRYSIGCRMGFGETYLFEWQPWYQSLTPAGQQRYQALYPEPEAWAGFYDSDEEEA